MFGVFYGCTNLEELSLPKNLKQIYDSVFEHCYNLKKIILPDGLQKIGNRAFAECRSLEELTIPASVKFWGKFIFDGCKSLNKITFKDKNCFPEYLKDVLKYFEFNSIETNGNEVTFIRNLEKENDD